MLQILLEHAESVIQIIVVIGASVSLYYRMQNRLSHMDDRIGQFESEANQHWSRQEQEYSKLEGRFDSHIEDPLPHVSCPAHGQAIHDIADRLDRIQSDIGHVRDDAKQTLMLLINGSNKK